MSVNTEIFDEKVHRAAMTRLYQKGLIGKVDVIIDNHKVKVSKIVKKSKSLKDFMSKVTPEIKKAYDSANSVTSRSLLDLTNEQIDFSHNLFEDKVGKDFKLNNIPPKISSEIVLKKPLYKDKTLAAGWRGIGVGERKRLEKLIRDGISEGKTMDELSKIVRKSSAIDISKNQSRALTVTATTSVVAQADQQVYKANEALLQGWQYVATLDSRTTPLCAYRDGKIFPVGDTEHLPPAHYYCRSATTPVFKRWDDLSKSESLAHIRRRNLIDDKNMEYYDGLLPNKETYSVWLARQSEDIQLKHLKDPLRVELFNKGQLSLTKFSDKDGSPISLSKLRKLTTYTHTAAGDTKKFGMAKQKLDKLDLWATNPDDFINNKQLQNDLKSYYRLQAGDLNGTLSLTNYRGITMPSKRATKNRILTKPPDEKNLRFDPITKRHVDSRIYQPEHAVLENNIKLLDEAEELLEKDKEFIKQFSASLRGTLGVNQRAVVVDNLRNIFTRNRQNGDLWMNFKAVANNQMKYDVMNVSDFIETRLRKSSNFEKLYKQPGFVDPVLGSIDIKDIHDNFEKNIIAKNNWELYVEPKIAKELHNIFDAEKLMSANPVLYKRLNERDLQQFYLKFARRLAADNLPDRDQLAIALGRDLYNLANLNGNKDAWYRLGLKFVESKSAKKFYVLDTFGTQKKRMKSNKSNNYFGPYYDTLSQNLVIKDTRIKEYSQLVRKVDVGMRIGSLDKPKLVIRPGFKTYFLDRGIKGHYDTGIPITSTSAFKEFPEEFIDDKMAKALNWTSQSKYEVDNDFYAFIDKLIRFEDDKGKAKHFNELNEFRKYLSARDDSYVRFKTMQYLNENKQSFSHYAFIDHRARIYDRGFIGPQSGETFRPFLNTEAEHVLGVNGYKNMQDQIGAFLGGLDDEFEGRYNSLTVTGRQKIAKKWRPELIEIGEQMMRNKPNDIRKILDNPIVQRIDGEELPKFFRFAIEEAKINRYLDSFDKRSWKNLDSYKTKLALEQDAKITWHL